jgi:hypothetical protein
VSAGLVTGSMAPDLPTYLPLGLTHTQTHPLSAIIWPDLLLGLGLLALWWGVLRLGVMSLWPAAAARCGPPGWRDPAIRRSRRAAGVWVGWLLLSELVGLATHLVWDSFTHTDGYVAVHWTALRRTVDGQAIYHLLQIGCSVIGIAIVAAYLVVQWRRRTAQGPAPLGVDPAADEAGVAASYPLPRWVRIAVVGFIALAIVATGVITGHGVPHPFAIHRPWLWRRRLVNASTVLLVLGAAWAVLVIPVRNVLLQRDEPEQPRPADEQPHPHATQPLDVP